MENLTDARLGTVRIDRIYRGGEREWNRFNWERWSCRTEVVSSSYITSYYPSHDTKVTASLGSRTKLGDRAADDGTKYGAVSLDGETGIYTFSQPYSHPAGSTLKNACLSGYTFCWGDTSTGGLPTSYYLLYGLVTEGGVEKVVCRYYYAYERQSFDYSRGGICYGTVCGYEGDYPADGRHSDGYWYVQI